MSLFFEKTFFEYTLVKCETSLNCFHTHALMRRGGFLSCRAHHSGWNFVAARGIHIPIPLVMTPVNFLLGQIRTHLNILGTKNVANYYEV